MALAALIVRAHVHAECRHADVNLVAVRTPAGLLVAQASMGLPVPSQIRRSGVLLAAIRTLVILLAALVQINYFRIVVVVVTIVMMIQLGVEVATSFRSSLVVVELGLLMTLMMIEVARMDEGAGCCCQAHLGEFCEIVELVRTF